MDRSAPTGRAQRVAIVGGGAVGLTLAWRLTQAGHRVTVLERGPEIGGLASAWSVGPLTWDRFYHVILESDTAWRSILGELGLDDQIVWASTRTGLSADGQLHSVSSPGEFLRLPVMPLVDRLRLGLTLAVLSLRPDGRRLEAQPVGDHLRRWSGRRAYEKFWLPLLRAKLGTSHDQASAAFIWATAQRLGRARRSGLGAERFGYVPGGYARILSRFTEELRARGVALMTGARVDEVEPGGIIRFGDATTALFDRVILTVPGTAASALCPALQRAEHHALRSIRYQGVVCVSVVLRRPLSPFYLTYLLEDSILTGVVDMSSLVAGDQFGGHGLLYLPRYVHPDDPMLHAADEEITGQFLDALANAYPELRRDDIVATRVARAGAVFAVPTLGYSSRVLPFQTSLPGVSIVNGAQIVNATLNVNESVMLAERAIPAIVGREAGHEAGHKVAT